MLQVETSSYLEFSCVLGQSLEVVSSVFCLCFSLDLALVCRAPAYVWNTALTILPNNGSQTLLLPKQNH